MSLHRKYLKILSVLAPTGAVGMSILLASSAPGVAREHPADAEAAGTSSARVSERLDAIRGAMSEVVGQAIVATESPTGERQMAWGNWGNGGFGIFIGPPAWSDWNNWHNWNNWHPWGNGWGNMGWHNW